MIRKGLFLLLAVYLLFAAGWVVRSGFINESAGGRELLHVANDPTRELWRAMNDAFIRHDFERTGERITIRMSHGGSGSQARAVIDGLNADIVSLGLWSDIDAIRKAGLIDADWETKRPNRGLPFISTMVFVVRKGNPKAIRDWPDLLRPEVTIVTPNPKTSGNGKWSVLAMWTALRDRGRSEAEAEADLTQIFRRVPVLDAGARGATLTFTDKNIGDVHLTWENEAFSEVAEAQGQLEIIYPSVSILAEPPIAAVDAHTRRNGTTKVVDEYLKFLYTPPGQAIGVAHGYRPTQIPVPADRFPPIRLIPSSSLGTWDEIQTRFFASGALFDRIQSAGRAK